MNPSVLAVSRKPSHTFSKINQECITLVEGIGVEGDAHAGKTVQHRSRVKRDPSQPNLRQVHLIHSELLDKLNAGGFTVHPGELGENITTQGVDLLGLPTGARLRIGADAVVEITGLRNPCHQINDFQNGMLGAVAHKDQEGELIREAGVMGVVLFGGDIHPGDPIVIEMPPKPHRPLVCV